MYIDNKGKDIFILWKGTTQGSNDTTLTAETQYSVNFKRSYINFSLSLHYNGRNNFLFVNATKIYQFQAKDSEIKKSSVIRKYLGDFSANNVKKTGSNGCVYDFFVDYRAFGTSNIIDIHKYFG